MYVSESWRRQISFFNCLIVFGLLISTCTDCRHHHWFVKSQILEWGKLKRDRMNSTVTEKVNYNVLNCLYN